MKYLKYSLLRMDPVISEILTLCLSSDLESHKFYGR